MRHTTTHAHVFVYGTLKVGNGNHNAYLARDPICVARLRGYALHALRHFPCAVPSVSGFTWGEVYRCTRAEIRSLDSLEGTPILYRRVRVCLDVPGRAHPLRAFAYVMPNAYPDAAPMPSGRWTPHTGRDAYALHNAQRHTTTTTRNATHDVHDDDDAQPWDTCDRRCATCDPHTCVSCPWAFDDAHDDATLHDNGPAWWTLPDSELCERDCVACDSESCTQRDDDTHDNSQRAEFDPTDCDTSHGCATCDTPCEFSIAHDDARRDDVCDPPCMSGRNALDCTTCDDTSCMFRLPDPIPDDAPTCPVCAEARAASWGETCATCRATFRTHATARTT